jgi:signal transduction histidine kinase
VARRRDAEKALEWMRVARDQAESASALKTRFVAMVSHELRTPLTSLLLASQRMQRHLEGIPQRQVDTLNTMSRAAERLRRLIEELLDYARVQGGHLTTRITTFDLQTVIATIMKEHETLAADKGLALRYQGPTEPVEVRSDQTLVGVVLSNLVSNAVKFTSSGSVEVTLALADQGLRLAVRDTGPGIPGEARQRIFEPFEHLEPVTRKHTPGMGLGLALVREIAGALGGRVELAPATDTGSTFTLAMPLVPAHVTTASSSSVLQRGGERR